MLAAVPDGDARDLLAALEWTHVCRPRDADGLAATVEELATRKLAGAPEIPADPERVARYERRALTETLAGVFDAQAPPPALQRVVAGTA